MKPKPKAIPVDVVAAAYVELTVAIVALEHRLELLEQHLEHLDHHMDRVLAAFPHETQILEEQLAAIDAFKAAARKAGLVA